MIKSRAFRRSNLFNDPDWFFWAYKEARFRLGPEVDEIYRRAQSVRIPQRNGERMLVQYIIHNGKFGTMGLIHDCPGCRYLNVSRVIDFYEPKSHADYDKTGYRNFIYALKLILFGNPSRRMNRKACEEFFNDLANFDLD